MTWRPVYDIVTYVMAGLRFMEEKMTNIKNGKRRDNKGRVLHTGESQRNDGMYRYKYVDAFGNSHDVYSWRLEPTDALPSGKRRCKALRDLEREIEADRIDGIVPNGAGLDVYTLCRKYIALKNGVKQTTRTGYQTVLNILEKEVFGTRNIRNVSELDAKEFLVHLQVEEKRGYSSIHCIRGVLRPAFALAVKNDYIRKNPFDWPLADVIVDDSVRRESISKRDERRFLEFIKSSNTYCKYYDAVFILFKTGLRISEFCGLTIFDIDLDAREINVDHQLLRAHNGRLYVQEPSSKKASTKTPAGVRVISMTDEVYYAFKRIITNRSAPETEPVIDGYSGFLFFNLAGRPCSALDWEHRFNHMVSRHNKIYKDQLPNITPHVCRHTFANNMANSGMNPTALQYLMGQSDISVTLGIYTHTKKEDAKAELKRVLSL